MILPLTNHNNAYYHKNALPPALELFTKFYHSSRRTKIVLLFLIVMIQMVVYWLYIKHYISERVFLHDELLQDSKLKRYVVDELVVLSNNETPTRQQQCYHLTGVRSDPQFRQMKCLLNQIGKFNKQFVSIAISGSENIQSFEQKVKQFAEDHEVSMIKPEAFQSAPIALFHNDCSGGKYELVSGKNKVQSLLWETHKKSLSDVKSKQAFLSLC